MAIVDTDVLVVGAGAAGLASAQRLGERGINFQLLEAADRVGGRVLTDYRIADGAPVETGALMIHGRRVITHQWASELGVGTRRLPMVQRTVFFRNRRSARLPWMALPFHPVFGFRAVYQSSSVIPRRLKRAPNDLSFAQFLDRMEAVEGARVLAKFLHSHINAADPDQVGALGTGEEEALSAEGWRHHFQFVPGYTELMRRRAAPWLDRIRLNHRVTSIRLRPSGAQVRAIVGTEEREFRSRAVIVTVSLGVLKSGSIEFDPPLREAKRRAIEALGFGPILETVLRLRGGDLRERFGDVAMFWGGTDTSFDRPFVGLPGRPEIISAFTAGREADRRARLTDQDAVDAAVSELSSILPSSTRLGEVVNSTVCRWPLNPLIRGGYSFLPPRSRVSDRRILAEPVERQLFFAGEATNVQGDYATVHGAIETGYRAAEEATGALRAQNRPLDDGN